MGTVLRISASLEHSRIIRASVDSDMGQIHGVLDAAYAVYIGSEGKGFKKPQEKITRKDNLEGIDMFYVVEEEKRIVAVLGIKEMKDSKELKLGPCAVLPKYQKEGLAMSLFHHVEGMDWEGIDRLTLEVVNMSGSLIDVYEKEGFKKVREFKYDYLPEHLLTRAVVMVQVMEKKRT